MNQETTVPETMPDCFNKWFLSLPQGRQAVLREDRWMLAEAAFEAGRQASAQNPSTVWDRTLGDALKKSGLGVYVNDGDLAHMMAISEFARIVSAPTPPAQQPVAVPDELRSALLWLLYHHQGGSSPIGQPIRLMLGIGPHDEMTDVQIAEANAYRGKALTPPAQQSKLYTCVGKGGQYEKVGAAKSAGATRTMLGDYSVIVYRDTVTSKLYFRDPDDFQRRMERIDGDTAAPEIARHQLSAEDLARVREAAKDGLLATTLPSGAVAFLNDGSEPDYSHLNCPACGGSGHIDDVQNVAPEQAEQTTVAVPSDAFAAVCEYLTSMGKHELRALLEGGGE